MPRGVRIADPEGPDIIEFSMDPDYLGHEFYSAPQRSILKAIYGLEMTREELEAFRELTEGRPLRKGGYDEAVLICGRGSGKTLMGADIGTYESVKWGPVVSELMVPGQIATGVLIAQNKQQAGIARDFIQGDLETLEDNGHSVLAQTAGQEKAVTGREIKLRWPVEIAVYPANRVSARGVTGLWIIGDEIAYWETGEGAYNEDQKVLRAVEPSLGKLPQLRPKRLLLSTPDEEQGVLWDKWTKRTNSRALVVKAPTWLMNPSIEKANPTYFADKTAEDPEGVAVEFGAEFRKPDGGNVFLPPRSVDQCVKRGRQQIPPSAGREYTAWIDAAFKHDRFSFGIAHGEYKNGSKDLTVVFDYMKHWTPPRKGRPLKPEAIAAEIATVLHGYGVDRVHGDQFADVPLQNEFAKLGIVFVERPASKPEKFNAFKNLRGALRSGLVELPDDEITARDLKGLVKKETTIAAPKRKGCYDDAATVVSRLVMKILPRSGCVDISELNAKATDEDLMRHVDWHERKPLAGAEDDPFDLPHGNIMEAVL